MQQILENQNQQMQALNRFFQQMAVQGPPENHEPVERQEGQGNYKEEDVYLPHMEPPHRNFQEGGRGGYGRGGLRRGGQGRGGYHQPPRELDREPYTPRWDVGFKLEVPEFTGSLALEEFLDWMSTVDELFLLKEVPADKKVALVAIRFKDRAAAWWQSYRYQRYLDGLPILDDWSELKREMRKEFLPFNYRQTLFQNLQSLTQGAKSVEDYTLEFYKMVARNQLRETQEQLVARYLHGLRPAIQEALQVHTFGSVTDVQTKAKVVEKNSARSENQSVPFGCGPPPPPPPWFVPIIGSTSARPNNLPSTQTVQGRNMGVT